MPAIESVLASPALSEVFLRLYPDPAQVEKLTVQVPVAGFDDPIWQEIIGDDQENLKGTPRELLVSAVMMALDGADTDALYNVAAAAVKLSETPEPDLPWGAIRDMIVNRASGGDTAYELAADGPLITALAMCQGFAKKGKSRKEVAQMIEKIVSIDPTFSARAWDEMAIRANRKPAGDFVPLLKVLISFTDIPFVMSPRTTIAVANGLSKLPKDDAMAILLSMKAEEVWHDNRNKLTNLLVRKTALDTTGLLRPLVERTSKDIYVSEDGPANVTMIVFCVAGNKPGAPLETFDEQLARRGIRAIYLADLNHNAFVHGVESQGTTLQATFDYLRTMIDKRPGDKIITLGASNSAIVAVASALALKADGVISLSGFVSGVPGYLAELGDDRNPTLSNKTFEKIGEDTDMRTWFARYDHRPHIHMHVAENKPLDLKHAEAISVYENITVRKWEGHVQHSLTSEMILRGTFGEVIDLMLAEI